MYDVIIIGGGVIGCNIARELSRYSLKCALLERTVDVSEGTSKANSAIVHSGHSARPGSLMAQYNIRGNLLFEGLCRDLDVPYKRNGSLNVAYAEDELPKLKQLYADGLANGVQGMRLVGHDELLELEPNLNPDAKGALLAESCAITCPYEFTVALAENAAENGVEFHLGTPAQNVRRAPDGSWLVETEGGECFQTRIVVNAAGLYSDIFNNQVSSRKLKGEPRKGQYWMVDRAYAGAFTRTIFKIPGKMGKGILVSPTVDGTIILGPTAEPQESREDTTTTAAGLDQVTREARLTWPALPQRAYITSFAGLRAHLTEHEFILGEPADAPNFFNAAGIESPGLTSSPAIGLELANRIAERLGAPLRTDFNPRRRPVERFRDMTAEEKAAAIARDPAFANIICRCECVTEADIRYAIRRTIVARTVDGVKRRTRAGMGRCQGGFCQPKVVAILADELHLTPEDILKDQPGSNILPPLR
jgi:glycerol-3-phosphate dehydrogenase